MKTVKFAAAMVAALIALSALVLAGCAGGGSSSDGGSTLPGDNGQGGAPQTKGAHATVTDARAVTWVNSIGTTWVQVIVEITNDGTKDLYLGSGNCDLEDSSGKLIKSMTMLSEYPEVLAPGEKGYMYEETTLDEPVEGELTVLPRPNVQEAKVACIRLAVSDVEVSDDKYGDIKIMGRVENTTNKDQSLVQVSALLYGSDGKLIGIAFTYVMDTLKPGDKVGFEMGGFSLPDTVNASAVANCVVYAYPTQFQF